VAAPFRQMLHSRLPRNPDVRRCLFSEGRVRWPKSAAVLLSTFGTSQIPVIRSTTRHPGLLAGPPQPNEQDVTICSVSYPSKMRDTTPLWARL
jgi:hypothetical protein